MLCGRFIIIQNLSLVTEFIKYSLIPKVVYLEKLSNKIKALGISDARYWITVSASLFSWNNQRTPQAHATIIPVKIQNPLFSITYATTGIVINIKSLPRVDSTDKYVDLRLGGELSMIAATPKELIKLSEKKHATK